MEKVTINQIRDLARRQAGSRSKIRKISMLTAYDYPMAKIIDESGVDIVLVGDSVGNVVLGYENTLPVTMADMIHHTKAAAKGIKRALLVADMPNKAAETVKVAVENARLLQAAGAEAVKIEGINDLEAIKAIIDCGIPVMGHLGFLPQSIKKSCCGSKVQCSPEILAQAKQLEQAGVFALVLELVEPELAQKITETIGIPTIGIGSGSDCDGQVLVTYDLIGLSAWSPKFVKKKLNLGQEIKKAVAEWCVSL
ncbi:3-methyl-2-oxobutanoate hydroxymethyltransferase [candidate division WOR-1 bacterium RIFOXYB2_FULL_42_35]|uniref:3-methyl-2-oxobutanoate hydroxymethyltransferase n=1 Tax=candidate division WOR-1 bacterium RIFOXYC2_FULL_41_25 TaxID=1802586 RepID=A0A1F4TID0_UNCSA|nr:MAG: 3-methyl-2-oxobutanoate hydroxymethyltransferase [candidate division WOR-1 bacterium RIFOXYA2_FULL_41_14]OGC24023.1 MAG: 3-methyl-2-oxobutanoate hydroxymethyltransferase [candidate division WOR-1 bacterium RIFOXYB2_FULL_42_35]OGC32446.1 MAG: 3-methyl-2-oxobutanoate hydroxymethyltransferase [candidate division WOR-1 bacterium RIFOXYC2_FULL_41_25]OGC43834.1 MAG: 3-methyl-2-oxobutanoate hydroxymethyltransferase [candidate division WOR-1 bacterium RIFOXYD2_FULL_41_8]